MTLTAADKREIAALCARRNELRRRGQFVGDSASEDMLDSLLKEDLRLRKGAARDAAPPAPVKSAAASNGRAVWYVQQFAKIFAQLLTDPVLKPIFAQMEGGTPGAAPAARSVVGSETLPSAEVPTPGNPSGEGTERLLPSSVGDSAAPRDKLAALLPGKRIERQTITSVLKNISTKGRR
jgi:hypothetical protein